MPDLLSKLRERAKKNIRKKGPMCSGCKLSPKTQDAVRELRKEFSWATIAATLRQEGVEVKDFTLAKHFREHDSSR